MGINSPDRHLTWQERSMCARNSSPRERLLPKGFLKWTKGPEQVMGFLP